jgi:ER degradation enhancer, mannosidase alpha-like 2
MPVESEKAALMEYQPRGQQYDSLQTLGTVMHRLVVAILLCACVTAELSAAAPINKDSLAADVRAQFLHAWNAYKKYAWGHDGLRPVSKTPYDWYGVSFYLTPLDALDTMILMGFDQEADSTRAYLVSHLSFDKDVYVKHFEFTIRVLGGLLSCYQLTGDKRLLQLADDLGGRMVKAFDSPTGLPYVDVNLKTGKTRGTETNPGECGTLLVEYGTLARLTGKEMYYQKAKAAFLTTFRLRSRIGLVGDRQDVLTGKWLQTDSHLSACIDSYYEYMVKCARLFGDRECQMMWDSSIVALNTYLADSTASGFWYGHADMNTGKRTKTWYGALDAFFPAVLVLAGDLRRAAMLQEACFSMWNATGIEPEQYDYATRRVAAPRYFLNPEIMESSYYLYRATGDERYLTMSATFLSDLKKHCRVEGGFSELKSVVTMEPSDRMESYFFAETLKYLYLIFAPAATLDFAHVTFNTEAHPLRKTW